MMGSTLAVALVLSSGLFSAAEGSILQDWGWGSKNGISCGQAGRLACFSSGVAICLDGLVPDNHYKCVVADVNIDVSACGILGQACCHDQYGVPFCYTGAKLIGRACVDEDDEAEIQRVTRVLVDLDLNLGGGGKGGKGGKGKGGTPSHCGALGEEPCYSTCHNLIRIPHFDVKNGNNLSKYYHVVSEVACLQKCEDEPGCNSAVYNNVHHECYTKSADASDKVLAAEHLRGRLVVLYCEHKNPGTCAALSVFAGFDLHAGTNLATISDCSRGKCADTCENTGSDCKASVYDKGHHMCYTKGMAMSEMTAIVDVNLALRLEVIACYGKENRYCDDYHMAMHMDGKLKCMRGD